MKYLLLLAISFFLIGCTPEDIYPDTCPGGCDAQIIFSQTKDINGYYHVPLDWTGEYLPYFFVDVVASEVDDLYKYNEESVVEARFDSNTSWILGII